jgi:hypothetical protein
MLRTSMLGLGAAAILLGGCAMTESRVRQQITESEARTAAAQAQLEDRLNERVARTERGTEESLTRLRRDLDTHNETQRRLIAEMISRQRDALLAQARVLDEVLATLLRNAPLAATDARGTDPHRP